MAMDETDGWLGGGAVMVGGDVDDGAEAQAGIARFRFSTQYYTLLVLTCQ